MSKFAATLPTAPAAGALIALAAWLTLAPSPARAACGDYVMYQHQENHPFQSNHPLPPTHDHSLPGNQPHPCSGPLCSGVPLPTPVPAGLVTLTADQWGCLTGPNLGGNPGPQTVHSFDKMPRPIDFSNPVYHPPRRLP